MATIGEIDLSVQWNEDFGYEFDFVDDDTGLPVDLTGFTVAMQVRPAAGVTGAALATGTCTIESPSTAGQVTIIISHTILASITSGEGIWRGAYDIRLTDPTGFEQVWVNGAFIIQPGVTQ